MTEPYSYPRAGQRGLAPLADAVEALLEDAVEAGVPPATLGPSVVQGYTKLYRRLPVATAGIDKSQIPLLYTLLGSGTPPLKMSKEDSAYQLRPVGSQRCGNCSSSYQNVVCGDTICSQIEGKIEPDAWCRVWNSDRF